MLFLCYGETHILLDQIITVNLISILQNSIQKIINGFDIEDLKSVRFEHPILEDHGDYSTNIAMLIFNRIDRKKYKIKSPRDLATLIIEFLQKKQDLKQYIEKIELAGPGFINFYLKPAFFLEKLSEIVSRGSKYGKGTSLKGKKIMVEYAHPNPFKSFHIGHLRGTILGEVICRLLENHGAHVIRTNYQGDVGMHIAKCLWAFKQINKADYPKSIDDRVELLSECYVKGAKAFDDEESKKRDITLINKKIYAHLDKEVNQRWRLGRQWSFDKFHEIFDRLGIKFDREYMESDVINDALKYIKEAQKKGILTEIRGAVIFDGHTYDLDTRVFLNSEGLPTYEGKEIGLANQEFRDFGILDLCIHNVAEEQISFFKVTFKVEELMNPDLFKGKQFHNVYGFVGLKKGKMSSRKGNVVLADKIMNEVLEEMSKIVKSKKGLDEKEISEKLGIGAVKYAFIKLNPRKYLAFDIKESININGDSGPYLQYTYARCKSILKNVKISKEWPEIEPNLNLEEFAILKWLYRFPETVESATEHYTPNLICEYLNTLAQRFNTFYNKHSILKAKDEKQRTFRLVVTQGTVQVLENGLKLLGIETPERV